MKRSLLFLFLSISSFANAQVFKWAEGFGGVLQEYCHAIAVDQHGNVYLTGDFKSYVDFNPDPKYTDYHTSYGQTDIFLIKLDSNGDYVWGNQFGSSSYDYAYSLGVDDSGYVYMSGTINTSVDFDPSSATHTVDPTKGGATYLCKFDPSGNFVWAGNYQASRPTEIAMGPDGSVYTTGFFYGSNKDFDPDTSTYTLSTSSSSNADFFISRIDRNGKFKWAVSAGSNATEWPGGLTVDQHGNAYLTGYFYFTVDFDPDTSVFNLTSPVSQKDAFVWKLDSSGKFQWAARLGGTSSDEGIDIAVDAELNVYTTGLFRYNADFDPSSATATTLSATNGIDAYISKLDKNGDFVWVRQLSGTDDCRPYKLTYMGSNEVMVTGSINDSTDFDLGSGTNWVYPKGTDLTSTFLASIDTGGTLKRLGMYEGYVGPIVYDQKYRNGNLFTAGYYQRTVDFNHSPDSFKLSSNVSGIDVFVQRSVISCIQSYETLTVTACDSYISPSGKEFDSTGTYKDTLIGKNQYGCDSFITVKLTILESSDSTLAVVACDSYTSPSGKYTWDTTGVYYDTIPNAAGCDSNLTIALAVKYGSDTTLFPVQCYSYTSPGGKIWTSSGTYFDTLVAVNGCDSVMQFDLTILESSDTILKIQSCNTITSPSGRYTWLTSGIYQDTLVNSVGCDSIISVYFTRVHKSYQNIGVLSCAPYTMPGGRVVSTSGIYFDTLVNHLGCDSIIVVGYTNSTPQPVSIKAVSCDPFLLPSGKMHLGTSMKVQDTLVSSLGCDSIINVDFTKLESTTSTLIWKSCVSQTSPSGKTVWNSSGIYHDTVANQQGCDSFITVDLTVLEPTTSQSIVKSCNQYISPSGKVWKTSGSYKDTLSNAAGCDSIITIDLMVNVPKRASIERFSCKPIISPSGIYTWYSSGRYYDTLMASNGCDSIITLDLNFRIIDTTVLADGRLLVANAQVGRYQWLDCENDMKPIPGATNRIFVAETDGSYAVEILDSICLAFSDCETVTWFGLDEVKTSSPKIWPNPADQFIEFDLNENPNITSIDFVDISGRLMSSHKLNSSLNSRIDVGHLVEGTYLIKFNNKQRNHTYRRILVISR